MQKQQAAQLLYMDGAKGEDIARMLSLSPHTVSSWVTEGNWKAKRLTARMFEQTSTDHIQQLIEYELRCLVRDKDRLEQEGNFVHLPKGIGDNLTKLYGIIKTKELGYDAYIKVSRQLMQYVSDADSELAKQVLPHGDAFLNDVRERFK